jgi:hypothetical protein
MEFHVGGTFEITDAANKFATIASITNDRVYYRYTTGIQIFIHFNQNRHGT